MILMIEEIKESNAFEDGSILTTIYGKTATEAEVVRFWKAFYQIEKKIGGGTLPAEKDWIAQDDSNIRRMAESPNFDNERYMELQQEAYYRSS